MRAVYVMLAYQWLIARVSFISLYVYRATTLPHFFLISALRLELALVK
jgi:hypothetical protein